MKTPVQQLYDFMEQNQYFIGNDLYEKFKICLALEKEKFMDFFEGGYTAACLDENCQPLSHFHEVFDIKQDDNE